MDALFPEPPCFIQCKLEIRSNWKSTVVYTIILRQANKKIQQLFITKICFLSTLSDLYKTMNLEVLKTVQRRAAQFHCNQFSPFGPFGPDLLKWPIFFVLIYRTHRTKQTHCASLSKSLERRCSALSPLERKVSTVALWPLAPDMNHVCNCVHVLG